MKLIKLNNEYHLFNDEKITVEGVFPYVTKWENGKYELRNTNNRIATSLMHRSRKIVASTQKEVGFISSDVIWIDRKQIECLLGVTDKAKEYTEKEYCMIGDVDELNGEPFAVYEAYKQALKDNSDKKFTLEEMRNFAKSCFAKCDDENFYQLVDDEIELLCKENTEWEAEVKIIDVTPDKYSQTQFEPYKAVQFIKLTPIN